MKTPDEDKVKCKICGKLATRRRVKIGDCHTDVYGKGDYGQGYSGAKGVEPRWSH